MHLQKLISTRAAHRKIVQGQLKRITADLCSEEISAILDGIQEKVSLLKKLNEKINSVADECYRYLSQTNVTDIETVSVTFRTN